MDIIDSDSDDEDINDIEDINDEPLEINYPKPKNISKLPFTGIFDLDVMILNNLNDQDLSSVCQVNRLVRNICNNDFYWMLRTSHFYSKYLGSIENIKKKYLCGLTWKEYYKHLVKNVKLNGREEGGRGRPPENYIEVYRFNIRELYNTVFGDLIDKYKDADVSLILEPYNPEAFKMKIDEFKEIGAALIDLAANTFIKSDTILQKKEIARLKAVYNNKLAGLNRYYGRSLKNGCKPFKADQISRNDFKTLVRELQVKINNFIRTMKNGVIPTEEEIRDYFRGLDRLYHEYTLRGM